MGKIVAMGGGNLRLNETFLMDKHIVELAGKTNPKALFIPTASGDVEEDYWQGFVDVYEKQLGCQPEELKLIKNPPPYETIKEKIESADVIYVGGGNTLRMMKIWRRRGVDELLRQAFQRGTVLCGSSAGAICWFAYGHSDSMSFSSPNNWDYIRVKALGLVKATFCPHVDSEGRRAHFTRFMGNYSQVGIGVDDNCALEIVDDTYRIITSQPQKSNFAYKIYRNRNGEVITEELRPTENYLPLKDLLTK